MKTTVLPALAIVIVGSLLGLGFNSVRKKESINLSRNYFAIARNPERDARVAAAPDASTVEGDEAGRTADGAKTGGALAHDFKVVDTAQMSEMVWSQDAFNGYIVVVDARDHDTYHEGHVPGAFNVYNYDVDKFYPGVAPCIENAESVVVYCGGGTCEDSIFLATELNRRGIGFAKLHVYEEGWKGWSGAGEEIETEDAECSLVDASLVGFSDDIHGESP